jgi:hypothetical protein
MLLRGSTSNGTFEAAKDTQRTELAHETGILTGGPSISHSDAEDGSKIEKFS